MIEKNLVIFFSLTGTCRRVANLISKEIGADVMGVKTKGIGIFKPIIHAGRSKKSKPIVVLPEGLNLDSYDMICIGGPVWHEEPSPALVDIIKQLDLKGKKVMLFLVGMEWGASIVMLKDMVKEKGAKILFMMTFKPTDSNTAVTEMIRNHIAMMG